MHYRLATLRRLIKFLERGIGGGGKTCLPPPTIFNAPPLFSTSRTRVRGSSLHRHQSCAIRRHHDRPHEHDTRHFCYGEESHMKAALALFFLVASIHAGVRYNHQHDLEQRTATAVQTLRSIYVLTDNQSLRIVCVFTKCRHHPQPRYFVKIPPTGANSLVLVENFNFSRSIISP